MQLIRKSLAFGQLPATKGDLYVPDSGRKAFVHNITFHNTNTTAETVVINYHDGTSEHQWLKQVVDPDDTFFLDLRGEGEVVEDGGKITGNTTTAAKVTFKFSGTEEIPDAVAAGGGGAEVLWEWNGTDITQFGNGSGVPDYTYNSPDGTLSVGTIPGSGLDIPSGNVLIYTAGSATSAIAHFLINDLSTALPERFVVRARLGPRVASDSNPFILLGIQDANHWFGLGWSSSSKLMTAGGNNNAGQFTAGVYREIAVNAAAGVTDLAPGILVDAECMMRDPGASTDPHVNVFVAERHGRGGEPHHFQGGLSWSLFGGASAWWDSSWQGGGTIKQPGITFTCNGAVQTPWIGELQIIAAPWTKEA